MSSVDIHDRQADHHSKEPAASCIGAMNLRALMDVMFGGAALALLLVWLVLSITGGTLG